MTVINSTLLLLIDLLSVCDLFRDHHVKMKMKAVLAIEDGWQYIIK